MEIETLEVAGFRSALHGMRNPMNSWNKSDSFVIENDQKTFFVGNNDKDLSLRLQNAGPEHCKHLRMIQVWADITAPLYWWKQFDCYRAGVEKISCSTMHKLMARPLFTDDFEHDSYQNIALWETIAHINASMEDYEKADHESKKTIWRGIIQALPQSYLQKRTVMFSYAALRNIYRQREGHKLKEWETFRSWVRSLPESWMITDELTSEDETDEGNA